MEDVAATAGDAESVGAEQSFALGRSMLETGRRNEAAGLFEEAVRADPHIPKYRQALIGAPGDIVHHPTHSLAFVTSASRQGLSEERAKEAARRRLAPYPSRAPRCAHRQLSLSDWGRLLSRGCTGAWVVSVRGNGRTSTYVAVHSRRTSARGAPTKSQGRGKQSDEAGCPGIVSAHLSSEGWAALFLLRQASLALAHRTRAGGR